MSRKEKIEGALADQVDRKVLWWFVHVEKMSKCEKED